VQLPRRVPIGVHGSWVPDSSLDWRQLLRRYVGQVLEVRPVFNRPPRRFPELLGIVPGAGQRTSKPKVMAVIDTSGSITANDLTEISGAMARLARHCIVTIVECDSKIHEVYRYRAIKAVHGRGGTDLRPPLEEVFLRKQKPDCVIYFTDGYGPSPKETPRTPVLWCITRGGKSLATWGRVVEME
jgi:predicted metal-dependent peptidase